MRPRAGPCYKPAPMPRMRVNLNSWTVLLSLSLLLGACGEGAGPVDAGTTEADAGVPDAGPPPARDTQPPQLTFTSLPGTSRVALSRVHVSGTVEDESGVAELTWRLNEGDPVALGTGREDLDFELQPRPGLNRLMVRARDTQGNETQKSLSFTYGSQTGAGAAHGGAVRDGVLYTWGRNTRGQLGVGTTDKSPAPLKVEGLTDVAAVSFGLTHSVALRTGGEVWAWGDNGNGQLGLAAPGGSDTTMRLVPVRVPGISDAVAIAAGYSHTLVLHRDGHVSAFGANTAGQLGDGTTTARHSPVAVAGLTDVVRVIAGSQHSAAVRRDGTVWVWGRNSFGNLGQGTSDSTAHATPAAVPELTGVVDLANGRDHLLALRGDGTVAAWGLNASGQLGDGQEGGVSQRTSPVAVKNLTDAVAVFAQGTFSFALRRDGTLWGWGENGNGQLCTGDTTKLSVPTTPVLLRKSPDEPLTGLDDVNPGATHTIARHADGSTYAWGWSIDGSLGGGSSQLNQWPYVLAQQVVLP